MNSFAKFMLLVAKIYAGLLAIAICTSLLILVLYALVPEEISDPFVSGVFGIH